MRSFLANAGLLALTGLGPGVEPAPPSDTSPALRKLADHPMQYWVARPKGWRAGERYPVLVAVPDATKKWEETVRGYAGAADANGARFVIVTPLVVTNGGANLERIREAYPYHDETWARIFREGRCRFDLEGTDAVLRDVAARDGGQERVFLAGIEAAAHTVFAIAFRRPERVRAAMVVSGNWAGRCLTGEDPSPFSSAPERTALPVRTIEVEGEEAVLPAQQAAALAAARDHGFSAAALHPKRLRSRAEVPAAAVSWFASLLGT